jgi:K+-sensing histidine kinase KdpD
MSSTSVKQQSSRKEEIQVPMADVARFVRQVSHDLRNHLNAAELQAAYIAEIAQDAEMKDEIKRLRVMVSEVGAALQRLTASLSPVRLNEMSYGARDFIEDLRAKVATDYPGKTGTVQWDVELDGTMLSIDPQILQLALTELFANAFRHRSPESPIAATARIKENSFLLTLRESKEHFEHSTDDWGGEPLRSVTQGHYGLGLHRARSILEAHRGQLDARYDPATSTLVTTVVLPLAEEQN